MKMKMQKAHVLEIIGKRPVGGVGTVMLNYERYMNPAHVQMDYLIFGEKQEAFDQEVEKLGSKVYTYPALSGRRMHRTKEYFEEFFRAHEGEYDIVHLHAPYIAFLCLPVAAKHGIRHRIVHSHATVYAESRGKAIRNRILWSISGKYITDRIGCSEAAGEFLFAKQKYTVLKNAICCEDYLYEKAVRKRIREQYGAEEQLVVGNVGRFSRQKNQVYLIDIFAEIKKIYSDSVLWLVGDGELHPQIAQRVEELGITDSVRFFGMVENTRELYQAMDVMVMPSLFEGLPMTGVEAQASGLPCVFADTITREVDVIGCPYLSLQQSPAEWARAAVESAERFGKEGQNRRSYEKELAAHGFDIHVEAGRLEAMYLGMR